MDIAIADYGIGNLRSAEKAFQSLGLDAHLTTHPEDLKSARKLVLPGVGAFGECMTHLRECGFVEPLLEEVRKGKPLLGICVGLQMLFENSEESPGVAGLGLLPGKVKRFSGDGFARDGLKIPQIGWNSLEYSPRGEAGLFHKLPGTYVYFVHSYHADPAEESDVLAWSHYGARFCAAAGRENVMGVQFHPEKSQNVGLAILRNFAERI